MTAWNEVTVTRRDLQVECCRFHPRVSEHQMIMVLFERRGIRMTGPATLIIAQPFEMTNIENGVVVRQGPPA